MRTGNLVDRLTKYTDFQWSQLNKRKHLLDHNINHHINHYRHLTNTIVYILWKRKQLSQYTKKSSSYSWISKTSFKWKHGTVYPQKIPESGSCPVKIPIVIHGTGRAHVGGRRSHLVAAHFALYLVPKEKWKSPCNFTKSLC
jgi:hypothetical protein